MHAIKRTFARTFGSPAFWPAAMGLVAMLFVALFAVLNPQNAGKAEAYTITTDGRIIINASHVKVTVACYEASYDNLFGIQSPSPVQGGQPSPRDLFHCKDPQYQGIPIDIGIFNAGELEFRITTPPQSPGNQPYTWYTGPAARNADHFQHDQLVQESATVVRIRWEDLYGGGDQDYNDCEVDVTIEELPTATPTATNTHIPTSTFTATPTSTFTNTPTPTQTYTPTPTYTSTSTPTNTFTPTATSTHTPIPTATYTPTPTFTYTPTATATNTPTPTFTYTPTPTDTSTPTPTNTFTPTATNTPTATATNTPTPTFTPVPPTSTYTPTRTFTPTNTSTPTQQPTVPPTRTVVPPTPTVTHTAVPTATSTATPQHPQGVGGAVLLPPGAIADAADGTSGGSDQSAGMWVALASAVAGMLTLGGWYAAKRRRRS